MVHFVPNLKTKLMIRYFFLTFMKLKIKVYLLTRNRLQQFRLITMGFIILWANNLGVVKIRSLCQFLLKFIFHIIILTSGEEVYRELWRYNKLSDRSCLLHFRLKKGALEKGTTTIQSFSQKMGFRDFVSCLFLRGIFFKRQVERKTIVP